MWPIFLVQTKKEMWSILMGRMGRREYHYSRPYTSEILSIKLPIFLLSLFPFFFLIFYLVTEVNIHREWCSCWQNMTLKDFKPILDLVVSWYKVQSTSSLTLHQNLPTTIQLCNNKNFLYFLFLKKDNLYLN